MKIGVAATGESLEAQVCEQFGRCPYFVIVDSETMGTEAFGNPAAQMSGGAGPAAVQELVNRGVQVAVAGQLGPKAQQALQAAGVRFVAAGGSVGDAVAACKG